MYKTKNLGLNITEIEKDKLDAFSFKIDLGDNFEAIDSKTLTHRNITNCLLEVPQDIKLELKDGVLTLKEGSKVYVPHGLEDDGITPKFDYKTIESDITYSSIPHDGKCFIFANSNNTLGAVAISDCASGATPPSNARLWYDTTNNQIKETQDFITWTDVGASFPILLVTLQTSTPYIKSIDQVFNGFGYIGSTVFALPGVKGLVPNGINEDGSLNNATISTQNVILRTYATGTSTNILGINAIGVAADIKNFYRQDVQPQLSGYWVWLNSKTNKLYHYNNASLNDVSGKMFCALYVQVTDGVISSLSSKPSFQAVDYYDYQSKITELETKIQALQAAVEALQG